ncbi:leucine-rich repeat-containing protein 74B-like isoform X2 [Dreissena polymorpha]|uniref:leucine-rich repeat-containing protein 74B-like isoform X2 n=1 Tax=Dreissena polymorpha TaxID=45954 RepID=UPI00226450E6|nr:leucine-rich repeat-containing protein 74B-like isoform X2 [Dreissena polymorpha]
MSTKMETFSLRPKFLREETLLEDPPKKCMEAQDIKVKLYLRECERLRVIPVSAFLRAPNSRVLKLKHYNMGPNGARALAAALMIDTVVSFLDLEGNFITSVGLASLKEALCDQNYVTYLNISDNKLGSRGAELIGRMMLSNHHIDTLHASRNGFTDADASIFANIIKDNRTLKELVISGNEFEEGAGCALGAALASSETLEKLDVSWNHIRKRGALEFAQGIKENVGLRTLDVSFNGFGTEGTAYMGQALTTNRSLLELDMSKNRITNIDMKILAKQLAQNDNIQVLRLGDNLINALGAMDILRAVLALETSSVQLIDFGTTCVDQGFLKLLAELQEQRPHVRVIHGREQNVYLDESMAPPVENPDQALSEFSGETPDDAVAEFEKADKGRTYVVDADDNRGDAVDNETSGGDADAVGGGEGKEGIEGEATEFNEHELDAEVSAVTGEPDTQVALVDARDGGVTETPDI